MSKANFYVDPDFPVIDGVGHSDKQGYFNVKGGGSTNTTNLDPLSAGHVYECSRTEIPLGTSISLGAGRIDPDLHYDASGFWQAHATQCLNAVPVGDSYSSRGSDRILMNRIEISGSVYRPAGSWRDATSQSETPQPQFPYHTPKCFVALVLDTQARGAVPGFSVTNSPFSGGAGLNATATTNISGVPFVNDECVFDRFKVLAFDVLDFECPVSQSMAVTHWEGNEAGYPVTTFSVDSVICQFSWTSVVRGFRFDVCLNDVLTGFTGPAAGDCTIANVVDNALHLYACNFNGHDLEGYATLDAFSYLSINYLSRLWFSDFLSPTTFAPAGAGGPVVDDAAPDLDVLADQSAILAGDAAEPRRKKTKASEGFFNFRPRNDPALDAFPDDFEFARLKSVKRAKSRASRGQKSRRTDDPGEFFVDEAEPPLRRGKY